MAALLLLFLALGIAGFMWIQARERALESLAQFPEPSALVSADLEDIIANPLKYAGRTVETEGFLRWITHMGIQTEATDRTLDFKLGLNNQPLSMTAFALSPVEVTAAVRGVVGDTATTNIVVYAYGHRAVETVLEPDATRVRRRVIGRYTHVDGRHFLRLYHWTEPTRSEPDK